MSAARKAARDARRAADVPRVLAAILGMPGILARDLGHGRIVGDSLAALEVGGLVHSRGLGWHLGPRTARVGADDGRIEQGSWPSVTLGTL